MTGLALPVDFSSRVIAFSRQAVPGTGYVLPDAPDGQAVFALPDGGWILVTTAETIIPQGGVSAIRFSAGGEIRAAHRILANTNANCADGATPWGTWMSCEESRRPGGGDFGTPGASGPPTRDRAARPARAAHRLREPAAHPPEHAARLASVLEVIPRLQRGLLGDRGR